MITRQTFNARNCEVIIERQFKGWYRISATLVRKRGSGSLTSTKTATNLRDARRVARRYLGLDK